MKITRVKSWKADLELTKPYTIATKTVDAAENVFLYIELENGLYGIGSGAPAAFVTGETIQLSMQALQEHAAALLQGKNIEQYQDIIRDAEKHLTDKPAALAAIDIALYDAVAKLADKPLVDFLGKKHAGFPTSVTIGIKSLEESIEDARAFVKDGFKVIKLKTGLEVEKDITIFSKIRETVGKDVKIRVDGNQGYEVFDLERFIAGTKDLDVEFIEQPFPAGDLEKMMEISADIRKICAADEDLHDWRDAAAMTSKKPYYGIFNIKLMKCGGVFGGLQIADIAQSNNIELMWGCNDESIVSITAALHTALACQNTRYIDLDGSFDISKDLVTGGFILKDGWLYPSDKPGLGVELIEKPF